MCNYYKNYKTQIRKEQIWVHMSRNAKPWVGLRIIACTVWETEVHTGVQKIYKTWGSKMVMKKRLEGKRSLSVARVWGESKQIIE